MLNNIYSISSKCMETNSRLVVYGTGKIGERYIENIITTKRCELVAVIASNYNEKKAICGIEVKSPDIIPELVFDYILIAVEKNETAEVIRKILLGKGVDTKK